MNPPWADRPFLDWMWVQLRTGLRQEDVYLIPEVAQPGCAAGTVSTRHWLNWRQANAVTVFGIEFMRRVAALLAKNGATPVHDWIDLSWHTAARHPAKHRGVMDPYGESNGAALVNRITYPVDSVTFHHLLTEVVPRVLKALPMDLSKTVGKPGEHLIAPYMWTVDLKTPQIPSTFKYRDDLREVVFTSPHYYCGYTAAAQHIPVYGTSVQWPLDPDFHCVPTVYDQNPHKPIRRSDIPRAATEVFSAAKCLSEGLGFTVGPMSAGRWVVDAEKTDRYVVTADVESAVATSELAQRAESYGSLATVGPAQPGTPRRRDDRRDVVRFSVRPGFVAALSESQTDNRLELIVESK